MSSNIINTNFRRFFPFFFPQAPVSRATHFVVDAGKIGAWISRFDEEFLLFRRVASSGNFSLVQKQIQNIAPLIAEGRQLASPIHQHSSVADMIDRLAKPRIAQFEQLLTHVQTKISAAPDVKKLDEKIAQTWKAFDLPASILEGHADCARFLFESGLIFTIVGYRESCLNRTGGELKLDTDGHPMVQVQGCFVRWETLGDRNIDYIKLDADGHPMIKMQGRFVRWETISRELHYDAKSENIKSKAYPGTLVQVWNYCYPQGLAPMDRFNYERAFPVYELTHEQYHRTRQHALKFYETNPEKDQGIPKDCIVQFMTCPRQQLPEHWLLKNANDQYPLHIGMRLITSDRKVYSFGVNMPPEAYAFIYSDLKSNFLTTVDAKITMMDYSEFRPHEGKVVTSIPLTSQRSQNILNFINEQNGKQLRFNYTHQNCTSTVHEVLKRVGYDLDLRTTGLNYLYQTLPSSNQLPLVGSIIAKVEYCVHRSWNTLPQGITGSVEWTKNVVFYVPKKFLTIWTNLLIWKLGAAKKITPLQEGVEDEALYDKRGIQTFSSVIRSWTDIFKDETSAVNHARYFLDWQRQQKSTFIDPYQGRPKFSIFPATI